MLPSLALAALTAMAACMSPGHTYEHGNVAAMPQTCQEQLDSLYSQYYLPTAVLPTTINCTDIIQSNLANQAGVNCTADDTLRACFNHASTAWIGLVANCELFSLAPTCDPTGGACTKPVSANPWWLRVLNALWRPSTYEYGTGVVPNKGANWQTFTSEGEGSRRRYRRLFAEGEGGGSVTDSGGCFPDFYDLQDFRDWLDGSYQSPEYSGSINPIGIIFWIVHAASVLSMAAF